MLTFRDSAICVLLSTSTLFASTTAATSPSPSKEFPAVHQSCEASRILLADDTVRTHGGADARHCYRLDPTEPGFLHLEISDATEPSARFGERPTGVRLTVLSTPGSAILARTTHEQLLWTEWEPVFVEVRVEDPNQPLPGYRLSTRWVGGSKSETDDELEIDPEKINTAKVYTEKSETDDELEIDPEKKADLDGFFACGPTAKSETDDELEIDPEKIHAAKIYTAKSETDDELEIDPEKLGASSCGTVRLLLDRLCAAGSETDDHGDALACASPIGPRNQGQIANGWGDDTDVFRFTLDRWQTVAIGVRSEIEAQGELINGQGQRLGETGPDTQLGNARLVQTLGPGTYFVRVTGNGQEGPYRLRVQTVD